MINHERPDAIESGIFRGVVRERVPHHPASVVDPDVRYYDRAGYECDKEDGVAARNGSFYYVKFSTAGSDIGHMFNPVGLYFREAEVKRDQAKTGRARYEFKPVPEAAFDKYMTFLKTKNESFLRVAERLVMDA